MFCLVEERKTRGTVMNTGGLSRVVDNNIRGQRSAKVKKLTPGHEAPVEGHGGTMGIQNGRGLVFPTRLN